MSLWAGYAGTRHHARLLGQSRAAIRDWLARCKRPVVSVSGGKDSVLLLALVREQDPTVPAIRADPPNPLPDRAEHVDNVVTWFGGRWIIVDYPWDVEAVLRGDAPYPTRKVPALLAAQRTANVDGVAIGIRAAESSARTITIRHRGLVTLRTDGIWSCRPLGWWSALDVLAEIERRDLPLNPVYTHLDGLGRVDMDHVRDGTWWPHGMYPEQRSDWMRRYYPEVWPSFDRALRLGLTRRSHDEIT